MKELGRRLIAIMLLVACTLTLNIGTTPVFAKQQTKWTIEQKGYSVMFEITSKWEGHFNGHIVVTNTSDKTIHNWDLMFRAGFEIENIWNATIVSHADDGYLINNVDWNHDIEVGSSREFGFTAKNTGDIACPTDFRMINYQAPISDVDYEVTYHVNSDWGNGYTAEITIANKGEETIEDWILDFTFKRNIQYFWSADLEEREENQNHYCIRNKGFNAKIKPGESLTIGIMGDGGEKQDSLSDVCLSQVSYKNFSIADNDMDGLTNEEELQIGSDMDNPDTDGDGLPDGYEYSELETSPCLDDTDGNGVLDGQEDFDSDKLVNVEEYKNQTDPYEADSDEDGLSDYEEIKKLHTDPLKADTDGDGLSDGDDVDLGFSPLKKDTDDNGVLDPDESSYQTLELDVDDDEKTEVTKVSVSFETSNHIKNVAQIENINNVDMMCSEVEGIVGVPVEVTSDVKFDKAQIEFYYDENQLGNVAEENLGVLWYDEQNNWFELQDDVVVDKENNIVTLTTTHFSKYMLVDSKKWYEVWSEELDYRGKYAHYDIAYAIDVSRSMAKNNRLTTAKKALKSFVEEQGSGDKGALITFGKTANVVKSLGSSKSSITEAIARIGLSEETGNSVESAMEKSIAQVSAGSNKTKFIILVSDGRVSYDQNIVDVANQKDVKVYSVNVGAESNGTVLQKYAEKTGGEYYYCPTTATIETVFATIQKKSLDKIDKTDKDKDGVYDVFEKSGVRLPNGKLIKTSTTKKDTDGDGLTDGEEMGVAYTGPMIRTIKIFDKKVKAKFFLLYSNPKKKDTDNDGVQDDKDPYPWHGYCGGKHPEKTAAHKCSLNEDGYYVCKKCSYKFKSAELEDAKVLTNADKRKVASLLELFAYYGVKNYRVNKTTEFCRNQKLLLNKIRKIRRADKYKNCYSYCDAKGLCIQKKYTVKGSVYVRQTKADWFDVLWTSGAVLDGAALATSKNCPEFSMALSYLAIGQKEGTTLDALKIPVEKISGDYLEFLGEKALQKAANQALSSAKRELYKSIEKLLKAMTGLLNIYAITSIVGDVKNSKVKLGDPVLNICIDRGSVIYARGIMPKVEQSLGVFYYHDISLMYAEMGANYGGTDIEM